MSLYKTQIINDQTWILEGLIGPISPFWTIGYQNINKEKNPVFQMHTQLQAHQALLDTYKIMTIRIALVKLYGSVNTIKKTRT